MNFEHQSIFSILCLSTPSTFRSIKIYLNLNSTFFSFLCDPSCGFFFVFLETLQKNREMKRHAQREVGVTVDHPRLCVHKVVKRTQTRAFTLSVIFISPSFHSAVLDLTRRRLLWAHGNRSSTLRLCSSLCYKVGREDEMEGESGRVHGHVTMETKRGWNRKRSRVDLTSSFHGESARKYLCMSKGEKKNGN